MSSGGWSPSLVCISFIPMEVPSRSICFREVQITQKTQPIDSSRTKFTLLIVGISLYLSLLCWVVGRPWSLERIRKMCFFFVSSSTDVYCPFGQDGKLQTNARCPKVLDVVVKKFVMKSSFAFIVWRNHDTTRSANLLELPSSYHDSWVMTEVLCCGKKNTRFGRAQLACSRSKSSAGNSQWFFLWTIIWGEFVF